MGNLDSKSTTNDVLAGLDLRGKRVLITGVSAGLGVETARALVEHGADVVGTARNLAKARLATDGVQAAVKSGGGSFELAELDLASLSSVRACSDKLLKDGRMFDVVIANAGIMARREAAKRNRSCRGQCLHAHTPGSGRFGFL